MKEKICDSLNSIVPSESQKDYMFQNITRPRNKIGGYILKTCVMAACFMVTFILFSNQPEVENNNGVMPRTIEQNCVDEECAEAYSEEGRN